MAATGGWQRTLVATINLRAGENARLIGSFSRTGVSNEKRIRFFPLPQEPLRETTQAPDHHSLGRYGGRLLQADGSGAWDALSEPDQPVSPRLRGAQAATLDSAA